jgi:hypothetical protein
MEKIKFISYGILMILLFLVPSIIVGLMVRAIPSVKILSRKKYVSVLLFLFLFCSSTQLFGKMTYKWQGDNDALQANSINCSPTRTTPATTDFLQFNTRTTLSITCLVSVSVNNSISLYNNNN